MVPPRSNSNGTKLLTWLRVPVGSVAHRVFFGAAWTVLGTIGARVAGFIAAVMVARLLGKEGFGRFSMINGTMASLTIFATMGMGVAATRFAARHRSDDPDEAGRTITSAIATAWIAGLFVAAVFLAAADLLAARALNDPSLAQYLRITSVALFFAAWTGAQSGALAGVEAFASQARISVAVAVLSTGLLVAGAALWGITGAVVSMPVSCLLTVVVQEWVLRRTLGEKGIRLDYRRPLARVGEVARIGVPAMLSAGVYLPTTWACNAMLTHQRDGYQAVATVAAADQWFNLMLLLPAILGQVLLPVLTNVFSQSPGDGARQALRRTFVVNGIIAIAILAVVAPCSSLLMGLYGAGYVHEWPVLVVLVAAATLSALVSPAGHALVATGRMWIGFAMNLGWASAYVTATYLLVVEGQQGALGLAKARLIAYLLHALWAGGYLWVVLRDERGLRLQT